ncbi:MAG TPA: hypothetical protein VFR15_06750 [Chloroflexia bacterium]|nr:hypothetical protein [Chloroflexia bacterium]
MFEMRDEYGASQVRGLGCGFWTVWALATAAGGMTGQAAGQALITSILPPDSPTLTIMLYAVPSGLVMGTLLGLAQGAVLYRYIGLRGLRDWVLASLVGGMLRWAVIGPVAAEWTLSMNTGIIVCNVLIPLALFGALAGAAFGFPQGFVFSRHLRHQVELDLWAWVLANAAGGLFFLPFVMLGGLTLSAVMAMGGFVTGDRFWPALIAMTLNWLITGIITGVPLRDRLRYHARPSHLEFS